MSAVGIGPWTSGMDSGISIAPTRGGNPDCVVRDIRSAPSLKRERLQSDWEKRDHQLASRGFLAAKTVNATQLSVSTKDQVVPVRTLFLRALVFVAAFVIVVFVAGWLGLAAQPAEYSGDTWSHSVVSGESLWGLAERVDTSRPIEQVIEDIRSLNGLETDYIYAGQSLELPAQ